MNNKRLSIVANQNRPNPKDLFYDEALKLLNQLLLSVEHGQINMEDILETVQYANLLLAHCQEKLKSIEESVQEEI